MANIYGPNLVTDGLVFCVDAANKYSYAEAGVIPPKSESIASAWDKTGYTTSATTVVGDDGVILHDNNYDNFVGRFVFTPPSTGNYTVAFEYQASGADTLCDINDDGAFEDNFTTTFTATTTKQIYSDTVNGSYTWASYLYLRRTATGGSEVTITNFRFYKSDSSGNSLIWHDLVGSYNNTLTNGPTFSSVNGGSIYFDASNDYTDTGWGSGLNPTTASYSFEAWVKADNTTTFQMFLAPSDHGSNQRAYFSKHSNGKWLIGIGGVNGDESIWSNQDVTTNWTHMAIILNSTDNKGRLYINGVLEGTGNEYASFTFNQNFNIGRGGSGSSPGFYWGGLISNVKIYASKALSATEVLQNFEAHKERFGL